MFESFNDFTNEKMVSPKRGHNYFIITKPVEVAYITGHYGMGMEVPGVLIKNKDGYFQGKKGAYIIDYFGAMYYVDMKEKLAIKISDMASQKELHNAIKPVNKAPEHADWKDFLNESVNEAKSIDKETLELIHKELGRPKSMPNPVEIYSKVEKIKKKYNLDDKAFGQYLITYFEKEYNIARNWYMSNESIVNEAKSIAKIQKEWGNVTVIMKDTVAKYKTAEGQEKEDLLDELKSLTAAKKKLEAELDDAVGLKDLGVKLAESLITEGMFSFKTLGDNRAISARSGADIYMFDDKGNMWHEENYEGYGIFGGKDYFELMAEMNGEEGRDIGIDLYYSDNKKVLYPALTRDEDFNWKRHKFTTKVKSDPKQGWFYEALINEEYRLQHGGKEFKQMDRMVKPSDKDAVGQALGRIFSALYEDDWDHEQIWAYVVSFMGGVKYRNMLESLNPIELVSESYDELNERVVTLKRRYTENYPAVTAGKSARIRNKMLEAIADGKITQEEFNTILKEMSNHPGKWTKRNSKYFNVSEEGISLSKFGKRALKQIAVNEEDMNEARENWIVYTGDAMKKFYSEHTGKKSAEKMVDMASRVLNAVGMMTKSEWEKEKKAGNVMENTKFIYESFAAFEANDLNEAAFVVWYEDKEGKHLLGTFHNKRAADKYKKEEEDEVLNHVGVKAIGTMSKDMWDKKEAPYIKEAAKIKMNALDWGKTTAERNANQDKYDALKTEEEREEFLRQLKNESVVTEGKHDAMLDQLAELVKDVDFVNVGIKLKKAGIKYDFSTGMMPMYKLDKHPIAIVNKKYVDKGDREVGDIAIGVLESVELNEDFKDVSDKFKEALDNLPDSKFNTKDIEALIKKHKEKRPDAAMAYTKKAFGWLMKESEELNEAFKSSKLRNLLTMRGADGRAIKNLAKAFYGLTKYKLDELPDAALRDVDPQTAYKSYQKDKEFAVFYIADNEKENPYGDSDWESKINPGIIGITRGKEFLGATHDTRKMPATLMKAASDNAVGGDKRYSGYGATGIYNVKRAAELADRAIVVWLNNDVFKSNDQIEQRADAKSGAIAFKSDVDFKKANMQRYKEILASKAAKLPLDKMIEKAIDELSAQIKDGLSKGEKTRYGDILIGKNKKGNDVRLRDASQHMSNILDSYSKYASYMEEERQAKEDGYSSNFYAKEAKAYAKRLVDDIKKIKSFDYAW